MDNRTSRLQCSRRSFWLPAGLAVLGIAGLWAALPASADYAVVAVTNGGTIDGVVTLSGAAPAKPPIKVDKNPDYCGASIPDPTYTVGSSGGLANVIVYLKDVTKGKAGSSEPLALVNDHCMFSPRAQGGMVGEQIKVSSDDTVLHNTHLRFSQNNATIFNIALPFKGFSVTKALPERPGLIDVKCDVHEWMRAWIMELDNPYYATTDADGHFNIKDVPPGSYTLEIWHEAAGEKSQPVVVAAGKATKLKITVAAK
jgi:hypothetical protein